MATLEAAFTAVWEVCCILYSSLSSSQLLVTEYCLSAGEIVWRE